jgi:hypothetical protein
MNLRWSSVVASVLIMLVVPQCARAAEDPLPGIGLLLLGGNTAEARIEIEKTRQAYVAGGNKAGEAVCDLLFGLADIATNKPADARANLEQSRAKFTAVGDRFGAWLSMWALADLERKEGSDDASRNTDGNRRPGRAPFPRVADGRRRRLRSTGRSDRADDPEPGSLQAVPCQVRGSRFARLVRSGTDRKGGARKS